MWSPPPLGHVKWNVDTFVSPDLQLSAIGGVLRQDNGCFKCMFSSPIPPIEISCAEILAIFRVIKILSSDNTIKSHPIIVESDSRNVVKWCNENSGGPLNSKFQLNFIRNARCHWMNLTIVHKGRATNMVADSLAKQGLRREDELIAWM